MDISGKTAIVTGAASGIGLGIATAARSRGMMVLDLGMPAEEIEKAGIGVDGLEAVRDQHRASAAATSSSLRRSFQGRPRVETKTLRRLSRT